MRLGLLTGRGPGAGSLEVLQRTRARTQVGAEAVPGIRQRVAFQTAAARRDADVLALQVAEDRARLTRSLRSAIGPRRSAPSGRAGTLAAVLVGVLLRALGARRRG
jgi:hypothetical protein